MCMCVHFQLWNHFVGFHETWNERYANLIRFKFHKISNNNMAFVRIFEMVKILALFKIGF
jgi:hypothetical protein